eukprot:CAMPEP_0181214746 /NCGR_PEP_ID=MMETSP1096-20121128/25630_1 /TAXON_ID=156174 ORGANISM="Chrysochromulina ericina, Strain CCMP281" /NCGR_SAMPLE_ID=MMETSP1096 /ASSEMBLY_ACC=CAM_ASM_000453 /LENGTH=91 /DNA_ID=CAMNT_0023306527 /DNA_START=677 /DNA_END=950 /DNA_ORIENTATION=-
MQACPRRNHAFAAESSSSTARPLLPQPARCEVDQAWQLQLLAAFTSSLESSTCSVPSSSTAAAYCAPAPSMSPALNSSVPLARAAAALNIL